jgi:hypothetical protein
MGHGILEFLEKRQMINGQSYRHLLDEKLELFIRQHEMRHFLQDGAPCHKLKMVTQWSAKKKAPHLSHQLARQLSRS